MEARGNNRERVLAAIGLVTPRGRLTVMHTTLGQLGPPLLFILIGTLSSVQRRDDANPDDRVWMAGTVGGRSS
jgi:hypothetical protein